jgi:RNA polymerase sigma factor (sigma-70 family)
MQGMLTTACDAVRPDRAVAIRCLHAGPRARPRLACDTEDLRRFAVMLARKLTRGQFDPEDLAHEVLERWLRSARDEAEGEAEGGGGRHSEGGGGCEGEDGEDEGTGNPRAWIAVVLRRLVVDRLRRRRTAAEVPADCAALPGAEPDAPPWWSDLPAGVLQRELGRLPPTLRETFELFSFQARSYQQIADQQNIAMGTVGTRINRARALLRRRLTEHGAGDSESRWDARRDVRLGGGGSRSRSRPAAARGVARR